VRIVNSNLVVEIELCIPFTDISTVPLKRITSITTLRIVTTQPLVQLVSGNGGCSYKHNLVAGRFLFSLLIQNSLLVLYIFYFLAFLVLLLDVDKFIQ
jgi:hypothetical protein